MLTKANSEFLINSLPVVKHHGPECRSRVWSCLMAQVQLVETTLKPCHKDLETTQKVTDSFYFQDIHKPSAHGDVAEWRVSASGPVNIFMAAFRKPPLKIQALTTSIDWDHRHTKPTALQNNKDVYSSLEHIFTNQTSIFLILKFWYDITGETFCIHQSQMRLTIIYGHIFPERLSHKQSENIC